MRRFTLITLIVLFLGLVVVAIVQIRAAQRDVRYPGPGATPSATPAPSG